MRTGRHPHLRPGVPRSSNDRIAKERRQAATGHPGGVFFLTNEMQLAVQTHGGTCQRKSC